MLGLPGAAPLRAVLSLVAPTSALHAVNAARGGPAAPTTAYARLGSGGDDGYEVPADEWLDEEEGAYGGIGRADCPRSVLDAEREKAIAARRAAAAAAAAAAAPEEEEAPAPASSWFDDLLPAEA